MDPFAKLTEISRLRCEAMSPDLSGLRRPPDDTHTWAIEQVDGGTAGSDDFFVCTVCGASGSPIWADDPRVPEPFLAGEHAMVLPRNCQEAKKIIAAKKP